MPREYKVGDHVVKVNGDERIITAVHPEGAEYEYSVRKMSGTKHYRLKESNIAGLYGREMPEALKQKAREAVADVGREQVMALAERYEGTEDGDRWLLLATTPLGGTIPVRTNTTGRVEQMTLDAFRVGAKGKLLTAWPFVATRPTGGSYRWQLDNIVLQGESHEAPQPKVTQHGNVQSITLSPGTKVGTIGELRDQVTALITSQNLDPNTPLYISDEDGNMLSKLYNLQVERTKKGKAVVVNVQDEKMSDEVYG